MEMVPLVFRQSPKKSVDAGKHAVVTRPFELLDQADRFD